MEAIDLAELRAIRKKENINLKPTPYLKKFFTNEFGEQEPVVIRNYQKQGILNLLMVEKFLLGDDTGIGKSLQALSAIGYIWMVEPEYVPIIITTKSALFQWAAETQKFMEGMQGVVAHKDPLSRHSTYEKFFSHDPHQEKTLLIMTYDMILRDLRPSIVGEKPTGPEAREVKKRLKLAKENMEDSKKAFQNEIEGSRIILQNGSSDIRYHISRILEGIGIEMPPEGWNNTYQILLNALVTKKGDYETKKAEYDVAYRAAHPVKKVPGILAEMERMKKEKPSVKFLLVLDEIHKVKNHRGKIHGVVKEMSLGCQRVYGLTATPVKNRLMEFWSEFQIIRPSLMPKVGQFQNEFCVTKLQPIPGGRKIPIIVGYRNLDAFVQRIEPYYLSRKKHEVAKELPSLITREIICELSDEQDELYDLAENGLLNEIDDATEADVLRALTLCQQAANAPQLIANSEGVPFEGESSKIEAIMELLDGDLQEKKTIIFSRLEKMISLVGTRLEKESIKYTRITGKENSAKYREEAKNLFQNPESGTNIILITTAGSESINLQAAGHVILIDSPMSWGDYTQLIGRAIRIGSHNETVMAHHLISKRQNGKGTIDGEIIKMLRVKKKLADKVAGENIKGGLEFAKGSDVHDVYRALRAGKAAGDPGTLLDDHRKIQSSSKKKAKEKEEMIRDIDLSDI